MYRNGWEIDYQYDWILKKNGGKPQSQLSTQIDNQVDQ